MCEALAEKYKDDGMENVSLRRYFSLFSETMIREEVDPHIQIKSDFDTYKINKNGVQHLDLSFFYQDIPLCRFGARINQNAGFVSIAGNVPDKVRIQSKQNLEWSSWSSSKEKIQNFYTKQKFGKEKLDDFRFQKCLVASGSHLQTAWESFFYIDDLPYQALVTKNEVLEFNPMFFEATANIQYYTKEDESSTTSVMATRKVENMSDSGTLCNDKFKLFVPEGVSNAVEVGGEFIYDFGDKRLNQATLFVHVNEHASWIENLPHVDKWVGPQLTISLDGK